MTRLLAVLCLLFLATALSGCGIRGDLKTPPPIWGADKAEATDETDAETPTDTEADPEDDLEDEDDDPGYGIRVADQP